MAAGNGGDLKAPHGLNGHPKLPQQPLSLTSLQAMLPGPRPWALSLVLFSLFLLFLPSGRTGHARDAGQTRSKGTPPPGSSPSPSPCSQLLLLPTSCLAVKTGDGVHVSSRPLPFAAWPVFQAGVFLFGPCAITQQCPPDMARPPCGHLWVIKVLSGTPSSGCSSETHVGKSPSLGIY